MGVLHAAAGALFAIAWFVFADGAWWSKNRTSTTFEFVECLPGILCVVALLMMLAVNMDAIQGGGDGDMFGGGGSVMPEDTMRHKVLFFFGALVFLSGLTVAVWLQAAKYKNSDNWWPGLALLLQCLAMMGSSFCLAANKLVKKNDDDGMAF